MSSISQLAGGILEAHLKRMTSNNPRTNELRHRKERAQRHTHRDAVHAVLVTEFAIQAVDCFAAGDHRKGRHHYDSAFAYGSKDEVRLALLKACVAKAVHAFRSGDHSAVRFLHRAAQTYPFGDLTTEQIDEHFASAGVQLEQYTQAERPLWLHELKYVKQPVAVAA